MKNNRLLLIAISVILVSSLGAASLIVPHLPGALSSVGSLVLLFGFFWITFDLIVKIIYKLTGVTKSLRDKAPRRLTHKQSETVNSFWLTWIVTALVSGSIYILLFEREQWKSNFIIGGGFGLLVLLAYIKRRQSILGYSKKDLFQ